MRFLETLKYSGEVSLVKLYSAGLRLTALFGGGRVELKEGALKTEGVVTFCAQENLPPCE